MIEQKDDSNNITKCDGIYNSVIYAQNYVRYRWMKPSVFAVYYSYMLKCIRSHGYNYVRMLDIGCGTGQFTVRLAEAFTRDGIHYHIDAVDTSTEGLHILESLIAQKRLTRINLINMDIMDYRPPEEYNFIICSEMIHLVDYNGPPVKTTLSNFIVNQIFPILTLAASRATPHI